MFGKVELNVMNMMEGQTLTDSSPAIFDVGSSKRDTNSAQLRWNRGGRAVVMGCMGLKDV